MFGALVLCTDNVKESGGFIRIPLSLLFDGPMGLLAYCSLSNQRHQLSDPNKCIRCLSFSVAIICVLLDSVQIHHYLLFGISQVVSFIAVGIDSLMLSEPNLEMRSKNAFRISRYGLNAGLTPARLFTFSHTVISVSLVDDALHRLA